MSDAPAELLTDAESAAATARTAHLQGWEDAVMIAADASGNYAGVFSRGPLEGMVAIFDHDDERVQPAFASLASFTEALTTSDAVDLVALPTELPRRTPGSRAEEQRERALFEARRAAYAARGDRRDAWIALAVAPASSLEALDAFFGRDGWVTEAACRVAAQLHGDAAIPALERWAVEGPSPNLPITCISLLRRMQTPASRAALDRLRPALGAAFGAYFPRSQG